MLASNDMFVSRQQTYSTGIENYHILGCGHKRYPGSYAACMHACVCECTSDLLQASVTRLCLRESLACCNRRTEQLSDSIFCMATGGNEGGREEVISK